MKLYTKKLFKRRKIVFLFSFAIFFIFMLNISRGNFAKAEFKYVSDNFFNADSIDYIDEYGISLAKGDPQNSFRYYLRTMDYDGQEIWYWNTFHDYEWQSVYPKEAAGQIYVSNVQEFDWGGWGCAMYRLYFYALQEGNHKGVVNFDVKITKDATHYWVETDINWIVGVIQYTEAHDYAIPIVEGGTLDIEIKIQGSLVNKANPVKRTTKWEYEIYTDRNEGWYQEVHEIWEYDYADSFFINTHTVYPYMIEIGNVFGGVMEGGYRLLCGDLLSFDKTETKTGFSYIPRFTDELSSTIEAPEQMDNIVYWEYDSNSVDLGTTFPLIVGYNSSRASWYNETLYYYTNESSYSNTTEWYNEYTLITIVSEKGYHPVYFIDATVDFGEWGFDFFDAWISMNWLRDIWVAILNLGILIGNALFYCLILAYNWLLIWLVIGIIGGFMWNIALFWLFYLLLWALWLLCLVGLLAWEGVIFIGVLIYSALDWFIHWIWEAVIIPLWEWFWVVFFPLAVEVVFAIISFVIATLIWCLTLLSGNPVDFWELFAQINDFIVIIADFIVNTIIYFIQNIPAIILFATNYLLIIGLIYEKVYYCRAKGLVERAERLEMVLSVFLLPFAFIYALIQFCYSLISQGGRGDIKE